jgi:hypothetical protein
VWGNERRLDDYLRGRLKRALDELAGIDPDLILTENVDVVVASLLGKHMPTEIKIDWDGATRTPVTEVTTQVRDQFVRDEIYAVPASKVVVSFPGHRDDGDAGLPGIGVQHERQVRQGFRRKCHRRDR